jgi:GntP family gluconate:H+ symporter
VIFLPIILTVARRFGGSVLTYALPAAGAFAVMHAFVPPHPGPVGAAGILGADIGLVLVVGLLIGLPTWFVASYLFGLWAGRRVELPVPSTFTGDRDDDGGPAGPGVGSGTATTSTVEARTAPPRFGTVLSLLLLPLVLILLNTGLATLATAGAVDAESPLVGVLRLLGQTSVALLITVIVAMVVLGRERFSRSEVDGIVNSALGPVCAIILITGAGGAFGGVLRTSGIGDALAASLGAIGLPVIVAAFLIATALRVAQGSATVALTTTAGLIAPVVTAEGLGRLDVALIVLAIAAGSTVLSHVNDSGFWLVGRFLEMDVKTTLKTWTVMETLIGLVGFVLALVVSLVG